MFGRPRRPATKGEALFVGIFTTAIGAMLSFVMISIEPAPEAPAIVLTGATLMAIAILLCGLWILATGLGMPRDPSRHGRKDVT